MEFGEAKQLEALLTASQSNRPTPKSYLKTTTAEYVARLAKSSNQLLKYSPPTSISSCECSYQLENKLPQHKAIPDHEDEIGSFEEASKECEEAFKKPIDNVKVQTFKSSNALRDCAAFERFSPEHTDPSRFPREKDDFWRLIILTIVEAAIKQAYIKSIPEPASPTEHLIDNSSPEIVLYSTSNFTKEPIVAKAAVSQKSLLTGLMTKVPY